MRKFLLFYSVSLVFFQTSSSLGSLGEITTQSIFNRTNWPQLKNEVNQKLKTEGEGFRLCFKFNRSKLKKLDFSKMGLKGIEFNHCKVVKCNFKDSDLKDVVFTKVILKDIDFSKMNLKNVRFVKCKLVNVNFGNSDLREVEFGESEFDEVNIHGALLCDGFIFDSNRSHEELLIQYSAWMTEYKKEKQKGSDLGNVFYAKCQALNKVLGPLKLDLNRVELEDLDLSEINLIKADIHEGDWKRINFTGANLKNATFWGSDFTDINLINTNLKNTNLIDSIIHGVVFSDRVQFSGNDLFLYDQNEDTEEKKQFKEKLFHTSYFFNYDPSKNHIWHHRDLHGVNFCSANLVGTDLSYSNLRGTLFPEDLQGANLTGAEIEGEWDDVDLRGAILTDTKLKGPQLLWNCKLQEVWLSNTVQIPDYPDDDFDDLNEVFDKWDNGSDEEKSLYQKLLPCGFNFFKGVSNEKLTQVSWQEKNLVNVNFKYAELQGVNLSYTNLDNAYLFNANLKGTNLEGSSLKGACLNQAELTGANLKNANLKNAKMGAYLQGANFSGAKLKGTDFSGASLSDTFILPNSCTDDILIYSYNSCEDQEAKILLEQILIGKKLLPKSFLKFENTEEAKEPPTKKMRIEYLIN